MNATRISVAALAMCALIPASATADGFDLNKKKRVLTSITYKNLTLMPIVLRSKAKVRKGYTVLDEGMKAGLVKVLEKDGGDVNNLTLENNSSKPLFLMAGEVIIGGKQDRIIGKDTIIRAHSKETVPVFCVEHGRWSGRKASFESTGALAHTALRKQAKYKGQSEVWKEVSSKNAKRSLENSTKTYRHVAQGKKIAKSIQGYQRHFATKLKSMKRRKDVVGFVVIVNGTVVAIESFSSPNLYRKLESKLLRSYFVEAVDVPVLKNPAAKPSPKAVKGFVAKAAKARKARKKSYENNSSANYEFSGHGVIGNSVTDKDAKDGEEPAYDAVYLQ